MAPAGAVGTTQSALSVIGVLLLDVLEYYIVAAASTS